MMRILFTAFFCLCLLLHAQLAENKQEPIRIGLVLSGGGALGFAHLGVLKVLERESIPISYISGNSMGSLVGGIYAAGYTAVQIESVAVNANWVNLFSSSPSFGAQYLPERQQSQRYVFQFRHHNFIPSLPSGIIPLQNVEFILMKMLSETEYNTNYDFDNLPIPYRAIAVDLVSGKKVILKNGRLAKAIRASIAIPGVFAPEKIGDMDLVDGGVIQNLPVDPILEYKPDLIIASLTMKHNPETSSSLIDVILRSIDLVGIEDLKRQKELVDIIIEPNVDPFTHSDFSKAKELIQAGEKAAEKMLPQIREKLNGHILVKSYRQIIERPLPIVRAVVLEGLKVSRVSMVKKEISTKTGSVLQFGKLINDLERLFNTGLFEDVNYRLDFVSPDTVDVIYELQELSYGFYSLGIRYDNVDNLCLGMEIGQGNVIGSGASIRGVIQLGNPSEYRFGITGTRLFQLPSGYRLDGFWNSIDHSYYQAGEWLSDYNIDSRGGIAEIGYILGRDAFFDIGFRAYQVINQTPPIPFFDNFPRQHWNVGPSFRMEYNSYDNLFLPTRGLTYQLNIFYSSSVMGASANFWKLDFNSERIIPLSDRFLLRYGYDIGISGQKLTLDEYFRTGGENLIGFKSDEFTTDQKAIVRCGTDMKIFNLLGRSDYPFYLRLFSNIATFQSLDKIVRDINIYADLNWGIGIGIKTNTPIGPFQLVLGVADFAKPNQYTGTRYSFSITVGRDFRYTRN